MKVNLFTTNIPRVNISDRSDKGRSNSCRKKSSEVSFTSRELTPNDLRYKAAIIKGLFEKFNIKFSVDDIESIAAPDELKEFLKKFKPKDFMTGKLGSENLFDNVKAKEYRVNLHSHTLYSDGHMTITNFLDQSAAYADEVAKTKPSDELPPYTTAITDHNVVGGAEEAILKIAQNPDKYKNLKFVPGCEFMFCDTTKTLEAPSFEAVSLGLNPFDKAFKSGYGFYDRVELIPKMKEFGGIVSYAHPMRRCQHNAFSQKLLNYLKRIGINGIESEYQYLGFNPSEQLFEQIELVRQAAKDLGWFQTGGTDTHATNIFHAKAQSLLNSKEFDWFPKVEDNIYNSRFVDLNSQNKLENGINRFVSGLTNMLNSDREKIL